MSSKTIVHNQSSTDVRASKPRKKRSKEIDPYAYKMRVIQRKLRKILYEC